MNFEITSQEQALLVTILTERQRELLRENPPAEWLLPRPSGGRDRGLGLWNRTWAGRRREEGAIFAARPAAGEISESWEKPAPNKTTFKGVDGNCPWNGDGGDPDTYLRKNRSDIPPAYHDVKWEAIHDLAFPKDKPLRKNWSPENIAEIGRHEGVAVRTIAYIVAVKPQAGNEEGTNCRFSKVSETDIHVAIVGEAGDGERNSVVVETTPRFLKAHPKWTAKTLDQ